MRITQLTQLQDDSFRCGKNCTMDESWIEVDGSAARFSCDDNVSLTAIRITIKRNATLLIGAGCTLRGRVILEENSILVIGDGLICNAPCEFHSAEGAAIRIGNDCLFADVSILNSDMHSIYDVKSGERLNPAADVVIGNRVWISRRATVLKGSKIANDSVVAAGAIVCGEFVESNIVLAGNPAKVIKRGIRWDRSTNVKHGLALPEAFSAARFRVRAQRFDHRYVIENGLPILSTFRNANPFHSYIFYYTARAIYEVHFKSAVAEKVFIQGEEVPLQLLHDVFLYCYESSNRTNWPCGAYLLATYIRLKSFTEAKKLLHELTAQSDAAEGHVRRIVGEIVLGQLKSNHFVTE